MYDRILVPIDGSPTSMHGLAQAIRWAGFTGAKLRLVHVLDSVQYATGFEPELAYSSDLICKMKHHGEALLASAMESAHRGHVDVDTALLEADSTRLAEQVVSQAQAFGAELIVIGTHGRRGVDRALLGSDAEQIVRIAPVPVLLVREHGAEVEEKFPGDHGAPACRRILVPIDGSETSTRGLDEAIEVAKLTGASLCLMHVVDELRFMTGPEIHASDTISFVREGGAEILENGCARAAAQGLTAETFLSEGVGQRASDLIVRQSRACNVDLLVLGTHGRRGVSRFFLGSDAESVVRESPVPVLLVRARARSAAPEATVAAESAA
jgi:nucleotide-binding universal stress UspA family protein